MFDISKDKPSFLKEARFEQVDFEFVGFHDASGTESNSYQQWKSKECAVFITYNNEFDVVNASCEFKLDQIKPPFYAYQYLAFVPAVIKNEQAAGCQFKLNAVSESLHKDEWTQSWEFKKKRIAASMNRAFEVTYYRISETYQNGYEESTYKGNGILVQKRKTDDLFLFSDYYYHENGQFHFKYTKTSQGVLTGLTVYYDEQGNQFAEHNFETFPFHDIGFEALDVILKKQHLSIKHSEIMLAWLVHDKNDLRLMEVDAVSGAITWVPEPVQKKPEITITRPAKSFDDFIMELVGQENVYGDDAEIIAGPATYYSIVDEFKKIAGNHIQWQDFSISKGPDWNATVTINNFTETFPLNLNTDWFDIELIRGINRCLRRASSPFTYYFFDGEDADQSMHIVCINDALADLLIEKLDSFLPHFYWGELNNQLDKKSKPPEL